MNNFKNTLCPQLTIFSAALLLRILYTVFLKENYFFYDHPSSDVQYYREWSQEIASYSFWGTKIFWGLPLYPYFLAVLDRLTVGTTETIRFLHLILGSVNCCLTFLLADRIFTRRCAWASGLLCAFSFILIHYDWLMMPVTLIIFLSQSILLIILNRENLTPREWGILGLILGLAILGDGKFLIFTFLVLTYFILSDHKNLILTFLKKYLPFVIGVALILTATLLRNRIVGGEWIPLSAQSGLSFYVGNNATSLGVYVHPEFLRPDHRGQDEDQTIMAEVISGKRLTAKEVSGFWFHKGLEFMQKYPRAYGRLLGTKLKLFFIDTEEAYDLDLLFQKKWKKMFDVNPFWIMTPLAIIGIFVSRRNKQSTWLTLLIFCQLIFTLIYFLTHRHRATILPLLIIFESVAFFWLIEKWKSKKIGKITIAVSFIAACMLMFPPIPMDAKKLDFIALSKAGPVYERRGKISEAIEMYFKALAINPTDTNTLYNLANAYALSKNWPQARRYYETVLQINPQQVDAIYNLANVSKQEGDLQKSLILYQKVIRLQPQIPDAYFQTAEIYRSLGYCQDAILYYKKTTEIEPRAKNQVMPAMQECIP